MGRRPRLARQADPARDAPLTSRPAQLPSRPAWAALRHDPDPGSRRSRSGDGVTTAGPLDPQGRVDGPRSPRPAEPVLHRQTAPHALRSPGCGTARRPRPRPRAGSLARAATDDELVSHCSTVAIARRRRVLLLRADRQRRVLRTAVQRGSLRELARTLAYCRPGVAAQVDLALTAETAAGAPSVAPRLPQSSGCRLPVSCPDLRRRAPTSRSELRGTRCPPESRPPDDGLGHCTCWYRRRVSVGWVPARPVRARPRCHARLRRS